MSAEQPIIVIKKKGGHGGHHGGAWKVAYADFVTAMMSLFIVLWLMNATPKETQEVIAGYFNDPKGTASWKGSEGKPIPKDSKESKEAKEAKDKADMANLKMDLTKAIENMSLLNKVKKQIEITVTEEGLRVELVEDEKGTFFESGNAKPTPMLEEILKVLANQLKSVPNKLSIEGYTDAAPYANGNGYSNWELSTDRANSARRVMQNDGIRFDQVSQVRGFGDQRLHVPDKPFDAANRRVSLVIQKLGPAKDVPVQKLGPNGNLIATAPAAGAAAPAGVQGSKEEAKPTAMVLPPTPQPATGLLGKAKGLFSGKH